MSKSEWFAEQRNIHEIAGAIAMWVCDDGTIRHIDGFREAAESIFSARKLFCSELNDFARERSKP